MKNKCKKELYKYVFFKGKKKLYECFAIELYFAKNEFYEKTKISHGYRVETYNDYDRLLSVVKY